MRSSLKTRLQETRFWKTLGIFLRATFRPSRGSVTDLVRKDTHCTAGLIGVHTGLLKALGDAALTTRLQTLRNRSACLAPSQPGRAPRWPGCCEAEVPLLLRLCSLRESMGVAVSRPADWARLGSGSRLSRCRLRYFLKCSHRNICGPNPKLGTSFHTQRAERSHERPFLLEQAGGPGVLATFSHAY